jgi:ABC-type antimicrobial peptide transport system permease subunit
VSQGHSPGIYVAVRTSGNLRGLVGPLRRAVREVDEKIDLAEITTLEDNVGATLVQERVMAGVSLLLGVLSLALAAIGVYGTLAYAVSRRTREIGIRMAIGADPSVVRRMVLTNVMMIVAAGLAAGLPATLLTTRLLSGFLFGLSPHDPATLGVVSLFLAGAAAVAAAVPMRRAARVDPIVVLRTE